MAKDQIIQTMVTRDTRTRLQQEADLLGLTMSAYLRNIIMSRNATPIYTAVNTMLKDEKEKSE